MTPRAASSRHGRFRDPFGPLVPLFDALSRAPLPAVLFLHGDDEWFVREGTKRLIACFKKAFAEGETVEYDGMGDSVREAINDVSTIALFATNRLVVLDGTEVFRGKKVTAAELDDLLDQARESGLLSAPGSAQDARALERLARKLKGLIRSSGITGTESLAETASKLAGRVKRSDRAQEVETLLGFARDDSAGESAHASAALLHYLSEGRPGDNALLVHAVSPDPEHACFSALTKAGFSAGLIAADETARRDRLSALGIERAVERGLAIDGEVFEMLTERGRLTARAFLSEVDKLILSSDGKRVTVEVAARLVADEKKEYGSDFVDAVTQKRFPEAIVLLGRLLESENFSAFRPFGKGEAPAAKGPKGDAAFFPLLGLLAAEVRRMLTLRAAAAAADAGPGAAMPRRLDYRTFSESYLPGLQNPSPGRAPFVLEGHPFVTFKSFQAAANWDLEELASFLTGLSAIDRAVKTGEGSGPELLQDLLLRQVVRS